MDDGSSLSFVGTPKWPDVKVRREIESGMFGSDHQEVIRVSTDTGRPVTPIFNVVMTVVPGLSDEQVKRLGQAEMQRRYERAHPNGCPERKAENSNPTPLPEPSG